MSDSTVTPENKLAYALLHVARTNSKMLQTLTLLKNRVAPDDKAINDALEDAYTQFEAQIKALEDAIDG